jgi:hypothetical protein
MQVCFFAHTAGELRQPSCEVSEETRLRASHLLVRCQPCTRMYACMRRQCHCRLQTCLHIICT